MQNAAQTGRMSVFEHVIAVISVTALAAVAAYALAVLPSLPVILVLLTGAVLFIFILKPNIALYGLLFTFPLLGIRWYAGVPDPFTSLFPDGIDLPLVDIIGLCAFIAYLARWALSLEARPRVPLALAFGFFLFSGALSLTHHPEPLLGLKYLLRPIAFSYLIYFLVPLQWLRAKTTVHHALTAVFGLGAIVSIASVAVAVYQLFVGEFSRIQPFSFQGFAPLGMNWNLLAEFLVPVVPIGIWLAAVSEQKRKKQFLAFLTVLVAATALLTFARSAWIALGLALIVLIAPVVSKTRTWLITIILSLILASPALLGMIVFSRSHAATSSLSARYFLTGIAANAFQESPLVGRGVGTFVDLVSSTRYFTMEFGDPLDAHGILQKVAAEQGFTGLLALVILMGSFLAPLMRAGRARKGHEQFVARIALAIVVAAFAYQLFNTSYYAGKLWVFLALSWAFASAYLPSRYAA